jgi:2,4-didehydro-3-deoxy-L-rhamnonate hydrolase
VRLATVADDHGTTAAVVAEDRVHPLPGRPSMREALAGGLDGIAAEGPGVALADVRLLAPVPDPPNLYMAGANYADHAREMRSLPADAPIAKPEHGPFMFLRPTTTLVAPGEPVVLAGERFDWEVELAVVIGRGGAVAGYTIANDVSNRARFVREPPPEPPMRFDWLAQKGWAASCPLGPWLVTELPDDVALRLSVNGTVEQDSRTSQMIFSVAEQVAYLSEILPLVPGDVICTGTPAGVGMGKGRFLADGDVMVAEIEGIGALENPCRT